MITDKLQQLWSTYNRLDREMVKLCRQIIKATSEADAELARKEFADLLCDWVQADQELRQELKNDGHYQPLPSTTLT